jgi:hypothetical protein
VDAFKGDILPAAPQSGASGAALAVEQAPGGGALAEQQLALEQRQAHADLRLGDHEQRLVALEMRLDPKQVLTEEQAAELALAVKNVGQRLAAAGRPAGLREGLQRAVPALPGQ